jgi:hypothetical protein
MTTDDPHSGADVAPVRPRVAVFWPPRRIFYPGLLVACILAATVAAAQANQAFLTLGAVIVATIADAFDLSSSTWLGWGRAVDARRVTFFIATFVLALVTLALFAYVIENKIYLGGS